MQFYVLTWNPGTLRMECRASEDQGGAGDQLPDR
jgi:hypothetical protein